MSPLERPATAAGPARGENRDSRTAGVLGIMAGVLVVVSVLAADIGAASAPLLIADPGAVVRWSLPVVTGLADLAAALVLGGALLGATGYPPDSQAFGKLLRLVAAAAGAWTVLASLVLVLSGAMIAGMPLWHASLGTALMQYATSVETGRLALMVVLFAAGTAVVAAGVSTPSGMAWLTAAAAVSLVPRALAGHAAGPGHEVVSSAWWLHALGAGAWVGGLAALVLVRPPARAQVTVVGRYSVIAGWAFALVAFSGVAGAIPRMDGWQSLLSGYGLLLAAKTVLLGVLGAFGWWHRHHTLAGLARRPADFWRLAGVELAVMAAAFGVAAALSLSPPPVDETLSANPTPAEVITGVPLPPPLTPERLITAWTPDVLWMAIVAVLVVAYLRPLARLRRRGDHWPVGRTISWLVGCALLAYVTCGGIAVYGRVLFSVHMVDHMALSMVAPPFLVFGAPVTLWLRAVPARSDGTRGAREYLLALLHSRYLAIVAHPVVAAAIFTLSLVAFYYTPLFGLALRTHLGHELMMVHFVLAGYLFVFSLVGVDPAPGRISYPLRLLVLFITMAFHAFFSVALMSQTTLLQATFFSSLGWGIDLLADQQDGGAIAWGVGDGPTLLIAIVVAVQWAREDSRLARRLDRAADRDDDAELNAYNEMLARLRERDGG
ncbi:MAG: cytochrome c oxidase assembly protein [Actinomycetales bacterium]